MKFQRRHLVFFIFGTALASLAFVYASEIFFGLRPCALCIYQRYFFWAIAGLSGLLLMIPSLQQILWTKFSLFALYLGNGGVAFYQILVEKRLVAEPRICQKPRLSFESVSGLTEQLLQTQPVSCADVTWSFLGISMAGYSLLYSLLMLGLMAYFQRKVCR